MSQQLRKDARVLTLPGGLALVVLLLCAAGWRLYVHESALVREQRSRELSAVADLKVRQLVQWRDERLVDVTLLSSEPLFRRSVDQWRSRNFDRALGDEVFGVLQNVLNQQRYRAAFLVDAQGRVLRGSDPPAATLDPEEVAVVQQSLRTLAPAASSFYRSRASGNVAFAVAAPVRDPDGAAEVALLLRSDPVRRIFPEIQAWPIHTETGEVELLAKEDGRLVLVNSPDDRTIRPMTLEIPLTRRDSVGVQAVLAGGKGRFEGTDYRQRDVLAAAQSVPDTPWVLLVKETRGEILAEVRYRGRAILALVALSILLTAASVAALANRRQQRLYRDHYDAERSLRSAVEREAVQRRVLFEQAKDGIVLIDADGNVVEANAAFAAMLARSRDEVKSLHPWDWDTQVPGPEAYRTIRPLLPGERGTFETRNRRADGTLVDVEASYALVEWDGQGVALQIHRDIGARKQAERRLHDALQVAQVAREQLQSIIEGTEDCIAAVDMGLRHIAFNQSYAREWQKLFGGDVRIGTSLVETLRGGPALWAEALANWTRAVNGERFTVLWEIDDGDGRARYHEITFNPIRDAQGTPIGAAQVSRDVTERRRSAQALEASEADLRRLNQRLESIVDERTHELVLALDRAEAASRVKDVFVATMSHELRTPLNSIIGFTDLLLNGLAGDLSDEQRTQLRIVNGAGYHLLALITDVLDLSKIEAGLLVMQIGAVRVEELLAEQCAGFELQCRKRGLDLVLERADAPVEVLADAMRVRQVLGNLLSNALKYTDQGRIVVRCDRQGTVARISVQDTGIGIPAADQSRLFQPFHRAEPVDGRTREGTGLGLALSRRLVEAMSGSIGVASAPGAGSTFWFTLPLAVDGETTTSLAVESSHG